MIRAFQIQLIKIFTNKSFWLCVLITFAMCFTATVGTARNGDKLNVFSYIMGAENPPSADFIINSHGGVWFALFFPMISALCLVNSICDDKKSKFLRFEIFRTGVYKFNTAKYISSVLSSGICAVLGYVAFMVFCIIFFPMTGGIKLVQIIAQIIAEVFIFGVVSAVPALFTAAFTNNKYLIVCVPFLFKYCVIQFSSKLIYMAYADIQNIDKTLETLGNITNLDGILTVISYPSTEIIITNAAILLLGSAAYIFVKGGADCGE